MPHEEISWWNFNIPASERTVECPDFLLNTSEKDMRLIGMWDADSERMSWEYVQELIRTNRIDLFQRQPSDLRRYRHYIHRLQKEHGSVLNFIVQQRLRWFDLTPKAAPFKSDNDMKILYNDWPYGIDERIVHLVVWTKFFFKEDPVTGDLTAAGRQEIEDYVAKTFLVHCKPDTVVWFKNWKSLKSVHAVEHFHVMLFDPDMAFIRNVTGGDVALGARAQGAETTSVVRV